MAMKSRTSYYCTRCNYSRAKPWEGKCPSCRDGEPLKYSHKGPTPRITLADHQMFGSGN